MARQASMNRLLQYTLGALVFSHIIPFLPFPHPDIRTPISNHDIFARLYDNHQKDYLVDSITWDSRFGCSIWHRFEHNQILWFANETMRDFLSILLSQNDNSTYTLGIRHARRTPEGDVLSWGPLNELDNTCALALLAKLLASVSDH